MKKIFHKIYQIYKKNWVKWFVIPFLLLMGAMVLAFIFNPYASLTTIVQKYNNNDVIHATQKKLLKGNTIIGEFKASENNLGIVEIRFQQVSKKVAYADQDLIIFRIKEKGARTWWYQNTYKTEGIIWLPLYPFGFKKISDSKNKEYVFSITSVKGNNDNAVSISNTKPIIVNKYVFTKQDLLKNKNLIFTKLLSSFSDLDFLIYAIQFTIPLIIYLLSIIIFSMYTNNKYTYVISVTLLILLVTIWGLDISAIIFCTLAVLLTSVFIFYSVESNISFTFAALFILLSLFSILFSAQDIAGRFSNWTYIFLVIGAVQSIREIEKPSKIHLK